MRRGAQVANALAVLIVAAAAFVGLRELTRPAPPPVAKAPEALTASDLLDGDGPRSFARNAGASSGEGSPPSTGAVDGNLQFVVETVGNGAEIIGLADRPDVNHPPSVVSPSRAEVVADVATPVRGVSITDPDDVGPATFGVLLWVDEGGIRVAEVGGLRVLGRQGSDRLVLAGSLDQVNAALAGLTVRTPVPTRLGVYVNDFGHGDLNVAGSARRTTVLTLTP